MRKTILGLIILTLITSGCTIFDNGSQEMPFLSGGRGLEITRFEAVPTRVDSGRTIKVMMDIENLGNFLVSGGDTIVYLLGTGMDEESLFVENDMKPGDPTRGISPVKKTLKWDLTAPYLEMGRERTQTYIGRIYYQYKSKVEGNVWAYTYDESLTSESSGKQLLKSSFTYNNGPVVMSVDVNPDPPIIYGDDMFTLTISIKNGGSGTIFDFETFDGAVSKIREIEIDELNIVDIRISSPETIGQESCVGKYTLIPGRDLLITCDLYINSVDSFKSLPIEITASYAYFTEKSTSVTVEGK